MMKRTRGIIAIFLLLAMLLTACGQSSQTPTVVDEPEDTTPVVVEPEQEDTATEPLVFSDQPANVFRAKFEGSNVAGKGEAVDGVYRVTATKTDGEAWHVKLESNYMTVPGRDYRVTYHFKSDVAGTVKFGDFQEFAIRKGENTVTGQVSASNGYTYLDLQLGALKPFTIDFTSIEVEELETEADYENVMTVPIAWSSEGAVYVQHDPGYFYKLDRHVDGVTMKVEEIPFSAEVWMSRLYVKTAAILEPGALYRVSADVSATHEMDMEVCFNNGDNEKGYGAFYGQRMGDMSKRTFQQLIDLRSPGSEGGEVVLQFAFGKSPDGSQVTVDNIRVEKVYEHYTNMLPAYFAMNGSVDVGTEHVMVPTNYTEIPLEKFSFDGTDSVYTGTNPGFAMSLVETESSATAAMIEKKADEDQVFTGRVYVKTGVIPEAGAKYRVSATVHTDAAFDYELVYTNGSDAKEYAKLWGVSLGEKETKTVTTDFTAPADGCEELVLKLQMGKSPLHNKVTISDVQVQKVAGGNGIALNGFAYPVTVGGETTNNSFFVENLEGADSTLTGDGNSATVTVKTSGSDWNIKFYALPGITLESGKTYEVSMDVSGAADYQVVYKSTATGTEDGFGSENVTSAPATVRHTITPNDNNAGGMEIVLKMGTVAAGQSVTVSNVKVYQVNGDFSYPVTARDSFFVENNNGADSVMTGDGNSATVTVNTSGDDWHIKFYVKPGITLESGKTYEVSMDVSGAAGYKVVYKSTKTGTEDAFGSEEVTSAPTTVRRTITPDDDNAGGMEIVLKMGKVAAGQSVTVSNVKVRLVNEDFAYPVTVGGETTPESFFVENNNGAASTLTGNGNFATVKVTQPGDDWHIKFYVKPGITLESGKTYEVSMDVSGAAGYQVVYKSIKADKEDGFGSENVTAAPTTVRHTITPNDDNEGGMEIILKMGKVAAGQTVTVSNVRISTAGTDSGDNLTADLKYDSVGSFNFNADDGYVTHLEKSADFVRYFISQAPDGRNPWNVKLNVRTGVFPKSGVGYRVKFDIEATQNQQLFEVFYDGNREAGYGQLFEQRLTAGQKKTVSYIVNGNSGMGELVIQIRLGKTDGKSGNIYTISNVTVEEVKFGYAPNQITRSTSELWTHEEYAGTLSTTATSATVRMTTVPAQGREAWKTKLFVETGAKLQAGQKYRITFTTSGSEGMPYEICLNHGGEEKGLGGIFGLNAMADGDTITYVTTPDKDIDLVLQFSLGNAWTGGNFTVRNIKVEKAGASSTVSNVTYTF